MRFFIIFLMIALNLTAEPKPRPSPLINNLPKSTSTNCSVYCEFQKELLEVWKKTSKNIKRDITIEMTFSDEQAKIDIAKAELQKVFLKFRQEGKFEKDTEIKVPIKKEKLK